MDISNIKSILSLKLGRASVKAAEKAPTALVIVGAIGVIATAVLASKATLKVEPIVDELSVDLEGVKDLRKDRSEEAYSANEYNKDRAVIIGQGALKIAKLYIPTAVVGVMTLSAVLGGHTILARRNAALVAAYKAIDSAYSRYRKTVQEQLGEEGEREVYRKSVSDQTSEERDLNEKIRKDETRKESIPGYSQYARFFDETCSQWSKTPEYNLTYLVTQQNYANNKLQSRGHIFLNEVYDMIGIPRTQAGAVVGWVLSDKGDNFVDFGVYRGDESARDFVNGYERSILLDFNVDGVIYDLI